MSKTRSLSPLSTAPSCSLTRSWKKRAGVPDQTTKQLHNMAVGDLLRGLPPYHKLSCWDTNVREYTARRDNFSHVSLYS